MTDEQYVRVHANESFSRGGEVEGGGPSGFISGHIYEVDPRAYADDIAAERLTVVDAHNVRSYVAPTVEEVVALAEAQSASSHSGLADVSPTEAQHMSEHASEREGTAATDSSG